MFCPKCGSILVPKKVEKKKILACSCGYKSKDSELATIKETVRNRSKEVEVIEKGDIETLPKIDVECPKCRNDKAFFWTLQTRASDEPETKFMKCVKCGHVWRDYN